MDARTYDNDVFARMTHGQHRRLLEVATFLDDMGEDCDLVLDSESARDYDLYFTGTNLSLSFDSNEISVVEFNLDTDDEQVLATFGINEVNKATHWLLTQVNNPNSIS